MVYSKNWNNQRKIIKIFSILMPNIKCLIFSGSYNVRSCGMFILRIPSAFSNICYMDHNGTFRTPKLAWTQCT